MSPTLTSQPPLPKSSVIQGKTRRIKTASTPRRPSTAKAEPTTNQHVRRTRPLTLASLSLVTKRIKWEPKQV
ncbi:MAG: hypothetical protein Q9205_001173 [Flavoplaca limonia]